MAILYGSSLAVFLRRVFPFIQNPLCFQLLEGFAILLFELQVSPSAAFDLADLGLRHEEHGSDVPLRQAEGFSRFLEFGALPVGDVLGVEEDAVHFVRDVALQAPFDFFI